MRKLTRRSALAAVAATIPGLAACRGDDDASRPTPTVPPIGGSPVAAVPGFADPNRWRGRILRVGAFGGEIQAALQSQIWGPFERLTGCVVEPLISDKAQLAASYEQNGQPYADVLLMDAFWVWTALSQGLVEAIPAGTVDGTRITAVPLVDGSLPAYAYAMVSSFRRDAVETAGAPETWGRWWDATAYDVNRALAKGPLGTFEFALLADGVDRGGLYPLDGARAIEALRRISGKVVDRWWETGQQPILWLNREQAALASAWHYRVVAAQQDGRPIDFVWNDGLLIADYWVVSKGAPAADVAWDYLRFALSAEVQASLATSLPLGPVVDDAFPLVDARTRTTLPTAPDNRDKLVRADLGWWATNNVEANERFNSWLLGVPLHEG